MSSTYNIRMKRTVYPCSSLSGNIIIPSSKSHTVRALLIAAMADGTSVIRNPLSSADTLSCLEVVRTFGAEVDVRDGEWVVRGTGGNLFDGVSGEKISIDVGNSGTTLALASGLAALSDVPVLFTGDSQIKSRPLGNLLDSLEDLGAEVTYSDRKGYPPFTVRGPLEGGFTSIECPTSQYLSSLLVCMPLAPGDTEITVPILMEQPYVEMTLRWLDGQSVEYVNEDYKKFRIKGGQKFKSFSGQVPGDFSSATFFFCGAAIAGGRVTLEGLDMTDSQGDKEVVYMLEKMGCGIDIAGNSVTVEGGSLKGCELDLNDTPDALPALAVAACYAEGETRLINVPQARLKETDRISVMREELSKMGADIEELPDGLVIRGTGLKGAEVCGHGDHRVIMALAVAALGAEGSTVIDDTSAVSVTFPKFFELLGSVVLP